MSQQDFEPDANEFTAAPEFTEAGFSTPGHDTWTSPSIPVMPASTLPADGARRRNTSSPKT